MKELVLKISTVGVVIVVVVVVVVVDVSVVTKTIETNNHDDDVLLVDLHEDVVETVKYNHSMHSTRRKR